MNRGYLRYSRKSTAPGNALQSIARSLYSVRRYFDQQSLARLALFGQKSFRRFLLSALLYRGFNYLNRAWAALFSALEQNTSIPFITNQFIGVIEQTASRADRSGAIQERTNSGWGRYTRQQRLSMFGNQHDPHFRHKTKLSCGDTVGKRETNSRVRFYSLKPGVERLNGRRFELISAHCDRSLRRGAIDRRTAAAR
jgi:hypothetical protein